MARPVPAPPQVQLSWLLAALGLLGAAAVLCAYLSLCLLFFQGQWQLLYHPASLGKQTPADAGLPFVPVQFGADDRGTPRLTGWWLPAPAPAHTVLYLHGEAGSLSDIVPALARIHAAGFAVFAIDYRGYGASAPERPSEMRMVEDAQAAQTYLVQTRHIPAGSLSVWGEGVGATIAAEAFCSQPGLPLVLEEINPPASSTLELDPRTRLLPLSLLMRDHLDPARALAGCPAPKLLLAPGGDSAATRRLYQAASEPKQLADDASVVPGFVADALSAESGSRP